MNQNNTKIAVIMPVYNAEKFLSSALESLINQSFQDIKIICVDDASPDNCAQILKEFASKDKRIVSLKHNANQSSSAARNTGLDYVFNY